MVFSGGTVQKIDDFIIEFCFDRDLEVDQQMSVEVLNIIMNLSEGKPHALLYNFNRQNILLSEIARKFSGARSYRNAQLTARAVVTQSFSSSLETTHYIQNVFPSAETRLFEKREDALEWLQRRSEQLVKANITVSELKSSKI
jgi:hypothetical protein